MAKPVRSSPSLEEEGDSPTTDRKQIFARNIARLADVLSANQKQAARTIGVPYKWLWRMASSGISRIDDRNLSNLEKVATFFMVPSTDDFWRPGLLYWLIESREGAGFTKKFVDQLREMYHEECQRDSEIDRSLIKVVREHPNRLCIMLPKYGNNEASPVTREEKLAALVSTGKYEKLKQLYDAHGENIDESYEREFGGDRTRKRKAV
jgi:hypothetical protein